MEFVYRFRALLKSIKDSCFSPLAKFLIRFGVTCNHITLVSFTFGILAAIFLSYSHLLFSIFIAVAVFLDGLDGVMARQGKPKEIGWFLDMLNDRLVMFFILVQIYFSQNLDLITLTTISYALVKGYYIFQNTVRKKQYNAVHLDLIAYIFLIFQEFQLGIYFVLASLAFNVLELLIQALKKNKQKAKKVVKKGVTEVKNETTYANFISLLRPILAILALYFLNSQPYILAGTITIIILLDALDGIVARRSKKKGKHGAFIDIIADRAVELIILYVYAYWGLITYLFPIIFTVRGLSTDFLRFLNRKYPDIKFKEPLSLGGADNRFIRGFYGFIKLAAFSLILIHQLSGFWLMVLAIILNLYRGLPVIFSNRSKVLFAKFLEEKKSKKSQKKIQNP